jgi:hypothetical protein
MAVSLRGVFRRYKGKMGSFSFRDSLGKGSLKEKLENLAREEHCFNFSECNYGGTAAFDQIWSHIRVRIKLNPDDGIPETVMNSLKSKWRNAIQATWSNRWGIGRFGEITCPITFEVQWVNHDEHHDVRIRLGPESSNVITWDTEDTGAVAAHEFGHMIGLGDEDYDPSCPDRDPVNTGTIMDDKSNVIPARMMQRFAENLDSSIVTIE